MDRELVVGVLGRSAEADVDGCHFVSRELRKNALGLCSQVGEAFGRRGGVVLPLDVLRGRTDEEVPEDRR